MMTANAHYREYRKNGGQLSFKDFMNEIKKNYKATGSTMMPVNKPLSDSINQTLDSLHRQAGYKDTLSNEYILGMPKNVFVIAGVIVGTMIIGYFIYKSNKGK